MNFEFHKIFWWHLFQITKEWCDCSEEIWSVVVKEGYWNLGICCPSAIFYLRIKTRYWTVNDLKISLMRQFPKLDQVSQTIIISSLKDDFNMSYKQLHRKPRQAFSKPNEKAFSIVVNIQKILDDKKEFELLFIDEFSVSDKAFKAYGLSKRGDSGWISSFSNYLSMSFFLEFSRYQFYGIIGNDKLKEIYLLLKNVIQLRIQKANLSKRRLVIVLDNASIHKSEDVVEFIRKLSLTVLTIPSYKPSLNPVEKFILSIKMNLRKFKWQDK